MVIETEEHAKARGAPILARLMGASNTRTATTSLRRIPTGTAGHAMAHVRRTGRAGPRRITDHVNAHATGTRVGDVAEAKAINRAVCGTSTAVYAPKSALGHSVGAAGAVRRS